jgi:hypothetical protein
MLSFNSYGEWTKVSANSYDDMYYIDLERIKINDGYVYWQDLGDFNKPYEDEWGRWEGAMKSSITYVQGDCKNNRAKELTFNFYKEQMGEEFLDTLTPDDKWDYFPSTSVGEQLLDISCRLMKAFEGISADQHQKIIEEFKVEIELERKKRE